MAEEVNQINEIDASHMIDRVYSFPEQIEDALTIMKQADLPKMYNIQHIIFTGMGGSAISGDIIQAYLRERLSIPITVNRSYDLPKWANKHTLIIVQSYSGNTEETLNAFKQAHQKSCQIIAISSGGKLLDYCERRNTPYIKIPSGYPPRAATGYILFCGLLSLRNIGIMQNQVDSDILETIYLLKNIRGKLFKDTPASENQAKNIAKQIGEHITQIYGWGPYEPIAKRWATQLNENSKLIARYDVVSESNHNDIVGWAGHPSASKQFICVLFRDAKLETIQMKTRLDFIRNLLDEVSAGVIEINAQEKNLFSKMMYFMYLGDFVSCYAAVNRGIDPTPVYIIAQLKETLEKLYS